jgi:hypothetical protein
MFDLDLYSGPLLLPETVFVQAGFEADLPSRVSLDVRRTTAFT